MPPIPLHIDDPIAPVKAESAAPQTDGVAPAARCDGPASNVATTTAAAVPPGYPPARPGAPPGPASTPYVLRAQPSPSRTTQPVWEEENTPSPPQPGAVPALPLHHAPRTAGPSTIPPPPRAGQTGFTGTLNQMYAPPPTGMLQQNLAPTHSTSTAGVVPGQATVPTPPPGPLTLNLGSVPSQYHDNKRGASSEQPAGYVQNAHAQEMSPAQRASLDQETRRESLAAHLGFAGQGSTSFGGGDAEQTTGEGVAGVWDSAKGWLNKAGAALADGERNVWKWIDGK